MARCQRVGGSRREVGMAIKGNTRDLCDDENALYFDYINVNILIVFSYIIKS